MLRIWPLEDRPDEMKVPEVVNALSFDQLIKYKKHYEALVKREGKGEGGVWEGQRHTGSIL